MSGIQLRDIRPVGDMSGEYTNPAFRNDPADTNGNTSPAYDGLEPGEVGYMYWVM